MSTVIAERPTAAPLVTTDQMELIKRTVAHGATADELKLYLFDCQRQGVHPLDKLVHFTKRGGKYTPITSIDFMRIRAAETNEYAGSDDADFDGIYADPTIPPKAAKVTVWRLVQGTRCSFSGTARWIEYCPPSGQDHMWKKMPHTMLAKCAEALALRKGFPRQLAGLYAREEMDQAGAENGHGNGYTVEAPKPAAIETHRVADAVQVTAGAPSTTIPEGAFLILKVGPGSGRAVGEVLAVNASGEHRKLPIFKEPLKALAESLCQEGEPVAVHMKTSAAGTVYLTDLQRWTRAEPTGEPVELDSIPFTWVLPLLLPLLAAGMLWS